MADIIPFDYKGKGANSSKKNNDSMGSDITSIFGKRIMGASPCSKCGAYRSNLRDSLVGFLGTYDIGHLEKLEEIRDGIIKDRNDFGSEILGAISDICKNCDSPELLLSLEFRESLNYYVEEVKRVKEEEFSNEEFGRLLTRCSKDLYSLLD